MLFKFKSKACSDLIMLEGDARRLLRIMRGEDPVKGIFLVRDLPQVIGQLETAVAEDEALRRQLAEKARLEGVAPEAQEASAEGVSLARRAAPMLKLLRQSLSQEADVVWGV
jgi:hypothetical protein